ncbi:hypothetical protein CIB95_07560 [Lottiidibacillus patelloidae]|uniref:Uncharacterized protein n=1 Tax=Lottiidibacillus patelloidae TaxID=2670334 RepID=A0A263BU89_9BACI|nr:hypothetical protein [Lottiidibacillus patelloidae]OZM57313.1 hypothetical protein CIB95_07560 [Lottiidibacillus patelloidae]
MIEAKQQVENKLNQLLRKMTAIENTLERRTDEEATQIIRSYDENVIALNNSIIQTKLAIDSFENSLRSERDHTGQKKVLQFQSGFSY